MLALLEKLYIHTEREGELKTRERKAPEKDKREGFVSPRVFLIFFLFPSGRVSCRYKGSAKNVAYTQSCRALA